MRILATTVSLLAATAVWQPPARAQKDEGHRPTILSSTNDTSPPLHTIRPNPPKAGEILELPRKMLPNRPGASSPGQSDGAAQTAPAVGPAAPSLLGSFAGVGNVNGVLPPDPNGDIGPNHYVQTVNLAFAIYSRAGTRLYGPANLNTLWSGFGGPCQTTNNGDPIVLYDHLADRWLISQFALPNYPFGPFYQCIAISQTPDPTGAWHRYAFVVSNTKMNDYPKIGLWPDGYYMSVNQFNQASLGWGGQGVVAFDRAKMLLGQPASAVYFDLYSTDPNLGGMLPSDLDGPVPPAGTPNYFIEIDDDAWGYSPDQLQIWKFTVNWAAPATSTFTKVGALATAAFDSNMCGGSRSCIPQPGTAQKVDAIADRLMYRLQYRNFGAYQTLVTNHTVDANGADRAGIRWYELRNSGAGWSIHQQSTYTPDTNHRWMGSAAMNGKGDIALGFSLSNASTIYPSIVATGRFAEDAANTLTQPELTIVAGNGSQTHSAARWGDYSSMSVDPSDDCTFWYTQEYYTATSLAGWSTRIGSFKLRDCGTQTNQPPVASFSYSCSGLTCSFNGTGSTDPDGSIASYSWNFGDSSTGSGSTPSHTYAAGGTYSVTLTVTDNLGATGSTTQAVTVTAPPAQSMHIGDLDGTKATAGGKKWRATVTITVHDASHNPVSGATVSGTWSNSPTVVSCTTGTNGQCSITSQTFNNSVASVSFTVTNATKASYTYQSSSNHDVDGGTNGTTIMITKP